MSDELSVVVEADPIFFRCRPCRLYESLCATRERPATDVPLGKRDATHHYYFFLAGGVPQVIREALHEISQA